jgi:hypothetical protein
MNRKRGASSWLWPILTGILFLLIAEPSFAKESRSVFTQGLINPGGNLKAGYLLINEMRVYIDSSTAITDRWGKDLPATELKSKNWVYLELEKGPANRMKARRIYLLPRYVKPEERKQFAFMK